MNRYEVASALRAKADKHEIYQLQRDNESLRGEIRDLTGTLNRVKQDGDGLREVVMRLIDLLSEEAQDQLFSELQSLRHLL